MYTKPVRCPLCDATYGDIARHLISVHAVDVMDVINLLWERVETSHWDTEDIAKLEQGGGTD